MKNNNGPDDYELRQDAYNAEYEKAYKEWRDSLTPAEITELTANGLDKPDTGFCTHTPPEYDFNTFAVPVPAPVEPESTSNHDGAETAVRIILHLMDSSNVRLELDALSYLFGLACMSGVSGSEIAARYGLTRAAFSKRVIELKKLFNVKPSRQMKPESACAEYALTNGATRQFK